VDAVVEDPPRLVVVELGPKVMQVDQGILLAVSIIMEEEEEGWVDWEETRRLAWLELEE
jgi:hypothetical protein